MWALLYTLATLALAHSGCASELSKTSEASRTSELATEASMLRGVFASFEKNVQTEQNSNAAKDTKGSAIIKVMSDPNNASDLNEASAFNDASVLNASSILNASSVLYDTSILNSPSIPELSRTGNCVSYINGALADHCPPGCEEYSDIDGVRGYTCRGGNFSYNVAGRANDYFKITCTSCVLDPSAMPLFPFSANGILPEVIVRGCPLADTLASLLARAGARGARVVTLDAPRGVISPAWVAGVEGVKELRIVRAVDQHVVPWDVVDALPELSDFRLRDSPVDADFPEGTEAARAHPSLSSLELAMLGPHALLPPAARARLPRLTHLYLRGNQIRDVSEDTFAGLDSVEVLDLSRNPVPALGARALAALSRLRRLLLLPTGLKRVETGAFDGLTSLMEVVIQKCISGSRLSWGARALAALPALTTLTLSDCPLAALPEDLLLDSTALETITITDCRLEALPAALFRSQSGLKRLNLRLNRLTVLPPTLLWPLTAMQYLNLDYNSIAELPSQLLSGLKNLESFSCDNNGLQRVAPDALQGAPNLLSLSLAHNSLTLEPEPTSSEQYESLELYSPLSALRALERLTLRGNRLRRIFVDWKLVLLSLKRLDLAYNNFTELYGYDLQFLGSDTTIDLRNNHIQAVLELQDAPPDLPASAPLNVLLLDNNPFRCDCHLYSFIVRLTGATRPLTAEPRLEPGRASCAQPRALAWRVLRALDPTLLTCPLPPRHCPRPCECLRRPAAVELDCPAPPDAYPNPELSGFTHTHLRLRRAPTATLPSHVTVLNLTGIGITKPPPVEILANVKELDLSGNNLTSAPIQLLTANVTLHLKDNPFLCDCSHADTVLQMQRLSSNIADRSVVKCSGGSPLRNVDAARLCDIRRAALLGSLLAILGLLIAVVAVIAYRYTLEIKLYLFSRGWCGSLIHEDELEGVQYDAFVSFSQEDARWVAEKLVTVLEGQYQFKLCVHYRDWVIGDMIPAQIARSVEESRRTIVVLSQSFLKSSWALLEFRAANQRAQREKRARVLLIVLDNAPEAKEMDPELRAYLSTNTYLKWGDPWFWEKLQYAMPHKKHFGPVQVHPKKLKRRALDAHLNADGKIVNGGDTQFTIVPDF